MSSAGKRIPIVLGLKIYNIFNFIINDMLEWLQLFADKTYGAANEKGMRGGHQTLSILPF